MCPNIFDGTSEDILKIVNHESQSKFFAVALNIDSFLNEYFAFHTEDSCCQNQFQIEKV